jgi:hypothetical protein
MRFLFKSLFWLALVGIFVPSEYFPTLKAKDIAQAETAIGESVRQVQKLPQESSMLYNIFASFFNAQETQNNEKVRLSNGLNTQHTLTPQDLGNPWKGPDALRQKR